MRIIQKIHHWFNNRIQAKKSRLPFHLRRQYTGKCVYAMRHKPEVREVMAELQGSDTFNIAGYNTALMQLWGQLDDETKEAACEVAREFNLSGPGDDLKPEYVPCCDPQLPI